MLVVRSLLFVSLCVAYLPADTVILRGSQAWYLADGKTVAQPVKEVIRLGGPIDPDDPDDDPTELEQLSADWKIKVSTYAKRDGHRLGLMAVHNVLADQIDKGKFSDLKELQDRTKFLFDLVLGDDEEKWDPWHVPIQDYMREKVKSIDEAASAYREIATGLSVKGEAIGSGWEAVIEFIVDWLFKGNIPDPILALFKALIAALLSGADISEVLQALEV